MADSAIPSAIDTPEVEHAVTDVKAEVSAAVAAVKADAKQQLVDADSAANKLLALAAGDVDVTLTDAEAAAVSVVLDHVPSNVRADVTALAQAALAAPEARVQAVVDGAVKLAIAHASAWLSHVTSAI